ncbi:MAG: substrate-binding periplasmic protein [Candidatus Hodarchaeota archaeon]
MKREIAVVGMVICVAAGFLTGWFIPPLFEGAPGPTLVARIKARGSLIVGTDTPWPPFEMYNLSLGGFYGFDIDLSQMVADALNVTLQMTELDFDVLVGSCVAGTIDMIAAAMFVTPDRAEQLAHSVPYIRTNMVVITKETTNITIDSLANLTAYNVGVQTGTAEQFELDDLLIPYTDYPKADVLMQSLLTDVNDVIFVDEPVFTAWSKTEDLKIIFTVLAEPTALFCRWEEPELMVIINEVILGAYTDGTLDALIDKWFT